MTIELSIYSFIILVLYSSVYAVRQTYLNTLLLRDYFALESIWVVLKCAIFSYLLINSSLFFLLITIIKMLSTLIVDMFDPNQFRIKENPSASLSSALIQPHFYLIESVKLYGIFDITLFILNYFVNYWENL